MSVRWFFAALLSLLAGLPSLHAQQCEKAGKLQSPTRSITSTEIVPAGNFLPPGSAKKLNDLPSFCRVAALLKPTAESLIHIEVWMPASQWNGKFLAVGSGGWGGSIAYSALAEALRRGYATAATDDGHTGPSASFAMRHREKLIDFAYRSEHEMTLTAKALIVAFYGRPARYSYWEGCSGGGREGLLQAYRYPDEFDGIIAGDPANIRRNAWALWLANESFKNPEDSIPPAKYAMIHRFVLAACDAKDGLKDGLIENPATCHPDFTALTCKDDDGPECLTNRQVQTAQTIISPAKDSSGRVLFPRLEPGTELRWDRLAGGPVPADLFLDEFRYAVYQAPAWDWKSFNLGPDSAKAHSIDKDLDELDPHLAAFARHGGKLLLYHGWADQQVAPGSTVEFYHALLDVNRNAGSDWVRLFMAPGMAHCSGGEGPDSFDKIGTLEDWVEHGKAPSRIIAAHYSSGKVDRTRPLCAYPQVAKYKGSGSVDDAGSFVCSVK